MQNFNRDFFVIPAARRALSSNNPFLFVLQTSLTTKMSVLFVIRPGFEPGTHSLEGCCSIQLSYRTGAFGKASH